MQLLVRCVIFLYPELQSPACSIGHLLCQCSLLSGLGPYHSSLLSMLLVCL